MEIVLISEDLFRENSPLRKDTKIDNFIPYIKVAQQMYIKPLLGKGLYFELQDQIANGDITPNNQALILKIAPCLAHYAVYQGLPFHRNAIVNKGVTQENSENSSNPTFEEFANTQAYIRNIADFYKRELLEYLCECRKQYPLWTPFKGCGCEHSEMPSNFGFYFPK